MQMHLPYKTCIQAKRMCEQLSGKTTAQNKLYALGQPVNGQTLLQIIIDVKAKLITLVELRKKNKLINFIAFMAIFQGTKNIPE